MSERCGAVEPTAIVIAIIIIMLTLFTLGTSVGLHTSSVTDYNRVLNFSRFSDFYTFEYLIYLYTFCENLEHYGKYFWVKSGLEITSKTS